MMSNPLLPVIHNCYALFPKLNTRYESFQILCYCIMFSSYYVFFFCNLLVLAIMWACLNMDAFGYLYQCCSSRQRFTRLTTWLDLNFVMPPNLFIHWECWNGGHSHKKIRKGLRMIWVIWKARNGRIFNDDIAMWDELVEEVKVLPWRWVLGRFNVPACLFYEWCRCPRDCLMR